MGGFLSSVLGTDSQYKGSAQAAGNPYDQNVLQTSLNQQQQVYGQQQALAQQLQAQAQGQGPNPAQSQFQQNVGQNNAQAQGLIASQRGLNPALAARMGANAGAAANQQAAGQAATLQAQQQLAAQSNLGNLLGQQQQGNLAQQHLYTGANQAANQINAGVASGNQQQSGNIVGGIFGGAGAIMGMADGGMIHPYAEGGEVAPKGPSSAAGKFLSSFGSSMQSNPMQAGLTQLGVGIGGLVKPAAPALTLPENSNLQNNLQSMNMAPMSGQNGMGSQPDTGMAQAPLSKGGSINFKPGGPVPGKADVKGNSLKNDIVPALVSPGEIVLPRSVTQDPDAADKAAKFVAAVLAKKGIGKRK